MWECGCGFANDDSAPACAACGMRAPSRNEEPGSLVLINLRTRQRIEVKRPGGIIGRAGDFCPDAFSPRVSRVHLIAEVHDGGNWTLEFVGRHKTELDAAGAWAPLEPDAPREVVGGEKLRMADMLFRLEVVPGNPTASYPSAQAEAPTCDAHRPSKDGTDAGGGGVPFDPSAEYEPFPEPAQEPSCGDDADCEFEDASEADEEQTPPQQVGWVIRCPVCGAAYPATGPDTRIDVCPSCFDPLDASKIAHCAPQPIYS